MHNAITDEWIVENMALIVIEMTTPLLSSGDECELQMTCRLLHFIEGHQQMKSNACNLLF